MAVGKVYLVGAGPGHPKLITVKGLEALQRSDCIVYDRLAGPHLLGKAKPGAELIYVGKLPDRHTMKQEEINQLLADLALQGKTVTRLKGGDPTIFGRVGEETETLWRNGIPYEWIPGITSAIAVPAYAGIPVTHRDLASSFSVITGHESPDKLDEAIEWDKVTHSTGTLVFLMGVSKIGYIAHQLMQHGRPPATPVALIRWGTRAEQQTLVGTLSDIEQRVSDAQFKPPAVIVVGEVVRQREKLLWYEKKPLFGLRILVTRARAQASGLADRIDDLGGEPYEFPVIQTRMPESAAAAEKIRDALQAAEQYDWVVLTSPNGVEYFFRWLAHCGTDIRRFHRARFAAVGPKTAAALAERGVRAELLPDEYTAEGLLEAFAQSGMTAADQVALLPRGNLARDVLPQELTRRGVRTVEIDIYETVPDGQQDPFLLEMLAQGQIHAVTFTSSSTVHNLLDALHHLGAADPVSLLQYTNIVCIGPIAAQTAQACGLHVAATAETSTIDGLIDVLCKHKFLRGEE